MTDRQTILQAAIDSGRLQIIPVAVPKRASGAMTAVQAMAQLVLQADALGWSIHFVEFCEDIETPGILGQFAGITDHARKKVKVATHNRSYVDQVAVLYHELEHVLGAEWATNFPDRGLHCGGRCNSYGESVGS